MNDMHDVWESRDLPVLRAIVEIADEGSLGIAPAHIAARIGMDVELVNRAIVALAHEDPTLFKYRDITTTGDKAPRYTALSDVTGHARRKVGMWPRPEDRVDQLVAALRLLAEREQDPEVKSRLRKTAEYVGGVGKDVAIGIFTGLITQG